MYVTAATFIIKIYLHWKKYGIELQRIAICVLYTTVCTVNYSKVTKIAFIVLSPSAIEASHPGLIRQFEWFAIITLTYIAHCFS